MFRLIVQLADSLRAVLAYAPSNRLLSRFRARGGPGSALAAITVGAVFLYGAVICTVLLDDGGPGWLNILVLLFIWNAFKLVLAGLVILVAHVRRRLARRRASRARPSYPHDAGGEVVQLRPR